jgi:hypothetical protein
MIFRRILAVILVICCIPLVYFLIDNDNSPRISSSTDFYAKWEKDIEKLKAAGNLPPEWDRIEKVAYKESSERTQAWIENRPLGLIRTKKDGDHYLTITLVDFADKEKYGVIVQYELFNSKSQNKIWELGRTFVLEDYSKKDETKSPLIAKILAWFS